MTPRLVNPESLGAPRGYSNGVLAPAGAQLLFVAGQVAWGPDQRIVSEEFPAQFGQALANVLAVVREAGGSPDDVCRLRIFVTEARRYLETLREVGEVYRSLMGQHFPAMALVEVSALLEPGALVEIEADAAIMP